MLCWFLLISWAVSFWLGYSIMRGPFDYGLLNLSVVASWATISRLVVETCRLCDHTSLMIANNCHTTGWRMTLSQGCSSAITHNETTFFRDLQRSPYLQDRARSQVSAPNWLHCRSDLLLPFLWQDKSCLLHRWLSLHLIRLRFESIPTLAFFKLSLLRYDNFISLFLYDLSF